MTLSANRAAKEAGIAKATLLEALKTGRMSASKNDKGHWLIDPAELFRVFPKPGTDTSEKPQPTPQENNSTSVLQVELEAAKRELATANLEREREREQLTGQIEALRQLADEQRADFRQTLAALTDQREGQGTKPRRGYLGRLGRALVGQDA
ncbi:hypothetical protein [Jannaschia aquimarina]|uniref:Uncharacterized protein n=1 Tax=Jannaschia aquimarina TaxID=935700 RepID=A0A0D1EAJ7_9RHOB|nr:hypothetical protein [Jannaschia aquimarina]KIT14724.1 hypothetical protein jaqu_35680 [Jannaschia aquimarina]SNT44211.1 hypothetical protein SAMN05421775_12611 [Jannaschia aquimarina]